MAPRKTASTDEAIEVTEEIKENNKKEITREDREKYRELEELKEQNRKMQDQVDALMKMLANLAPQQNTPQINSLLDEVKIVHLVDRADGLSTHIQLSNMSIDFHTFGEERTLDRRQAEELAGSCRKFFEKGILAFGPGNEDLARRFSINSVNQYEYMRTDFVKRLGSLNVKEIDDLYNKLCDGHKKFIIEYFKRKIIEKDPAFNDVFKIEVLNRLSGGAMSDVILDRQRDAIK